MRSAVVVGKVDGETGEEMQRDVGKASSL